MCGLALRQLFRCAPHRPTVGPGCVVDIAARVRSGLFLFYSSPVLSENEANSTLAPLCQTPRDTTLPYTAIECTLLLHEVMHVDGRPPGE